MAGFCYVTNFSIIVGTCSGGECCGQHCQVAGGHPLPPGCSSNLGSHCACLASGRQALDRAGVCCGGAPAQHAASQALATPHCLARCGPTGQFPGPPVQLQSWRLCCVLCLLVTVIRPSICYTMGCSLLAQSAFMFDLYRRQSCAWGLASEACAALRCTNTTCALQPLVHWVS